MAAKTVFERAQRYGLAYPDHVLHRNVYPTEEALADLSHFDEDLPHAPTDAEEIIDDLNRYGSPATVARVGGQYFGLVRHLAAGF